MEEHEYTSSDITEASIKANAHEFITELKDQYDTGMSQYCSGYRINTVVVMCFIVMFRNW